MKKRLLTLVSCLLVVAMCVALLAACVVIEDDTVGAEFENFVYNYGNITTKNSTYTVPNKIDTLDSKGGDAVIYVKWEKGGNDANLVTLTEGEDETTVSLPNLSGQISYTLTATFVNAKGKEYLDSNKNPYSHTFTCNVTLGTTGGGGGTGGNSGSYTPVDGNGTQSSPYTVAQAVAIAGAQEKNAYLDYCYVKGVVTKITYTGDATKSWSFEMSDGSGTTVLKGFYVYLGNGITTLEVGDIVTVYGQLVNFDDGKNAALEITAQKGATQSATIVAKDGSDSGNQGGNSGSYTPVDGNGTQNSPYTVAQAVAIAGAQEKNAYLDYCYVKGVVTKITYTGDATKSWSFEMSDGSGTTVLKGFYVYLGNGITTLEVGDIVTVYGQLVNFDDGKNAALEITAQKGATQSATIVSKG